MLKLSNTSTYLLQLFCHVQQSFYVSQILFQNDVLETFWRGRHLYIETIKGGREGQMNERTNEGREVQRKKLQKGLNKLPNVPLLFSAA